VPYREKCARCDNPAALKWTIFNGHEACVAPLCSEHSNDLNELVTIVGTKPVLHTGTIPTVPVRLPKARPIAGWVKPEDN